MGDPFWAPPPERPFIEAVGRSPGRLRIAFTTKNQSGVPVHSDCIHALEEASRLCVELGHEVIEDEPAIDHSAYQNASSIYLLIPSFLIGYWARRTGNAPSSEQFEPLTWALYEWGKQQDAASMYDGLKAFQIVTRNMFQFFAEYDILLTPTLAEPPIHLGELDATPENPLAGLVRGGSFAPFTMICNVTGQPAMSLPLFWNAENLPIGTQFIGRYGDEATLFSLAAQLEEAHTWANRRPPV